METQQIQANKSNQNLRNIQEEDFVNLPLVEAEVENLPNILDAENLDSLSDFHNSLDKQFEPISNVRKWDKFQCV